MTINSTDIKLLQSERMTDTANGGGRKTSRVVVDGLAGNVFPKVSRLDSTYGRVNFRKVYGAVNTPNLDVYAGAHAIITDAPDNSEIHTLLFSTGSDYDTRTAARDRVESYVITGPESRMTVYGRQLVGQQAVLVYQRVEEPLPEVGEVYCLSKEVAGVTIYQQFVRAIELTQEVRTLTDGSGDFERRVISLKIGSPLRYEFKGLDVPSRFTSASAEAHMRTTAVADASRYFGIKKLTEAVTQDALEVTVDSVYSPIVPTTQRESAVSLATIGGAISVVDAALSSTGMTTVYTATAFVPDLTLDIPLPSPAKRVALRVQLSNNGGSTLALFTDAQGVVPEIRPGAADLIIYNGKVDYETSTLRISTRMPLGSTVSVDYIPAVESAQPARTLDIPINIGNRGVVYTLPLDPLPAPGSAIIDYRSLGKWYRLRDIGGGVISGNDSAYGVGTVDYTTGALIITLGALPDLDSSVIISWGSPVDYKILTGAAADADMTLGQEFTLASLPVNPNTLSIAFTSGVDTYAATANSLGVITGNGVTGTVNHTTGLVRIRYTTRIPNSGSNVVSTYSQSTPAVLGDPAVVTGVLPLAGVTLPTLPVLAGSFTALMPFTSATQKTVAPVKVVDDGSGYLVILRGTPIGASSWGSRSVASADTVVGTINYTTGAVAITNPAFTKTASGYVVPGETTPRQPNDGNIGNGSYGGGTISYVADRWQEVITDDNTLSGDGTYTYQVSGLSGLVAGVVDTFSTIAAPLTLDFTKVTANQVVPGSLRFSITSNAITKQFNERNGVLYGNFNPATGSSIACGTVDYSTGKVALTGLWPDGGTSHSISVISCLSTYGDFPVIEAFFRTTGSPLRPASLYIQVTSLAGNLLSGTSDASGAIAGTGMRGTVAQETGIVRLEFGSLVGSDWVPTVVAPDTLRYSCVVLSNLPLNADILGLDPVRLPSDGRVPIYRPADVVVIHNTESYTLVNPAVAGADYSVGRTGLSDIWLVDALGVKVPTTKYTTNLPTGVITMAADLDLAGFEQPLKANHRVEEMQLLSDVQINGQLGLTNPLARDYPADTFVSSALLFGDLSAELPVSFDQGTWTGVWQDTLIGSAATAQYNDIDYPFELLNDGAVTDRWRLSFTSANPSSGTANFQIISENLGVIGTGNTGSDCAPENALTEKPYFVIRAAGWGLGWAIGNQLRFDTTAASRPIWISRTVLPGATLDGDSFDMQVRGDVDA